MSSSPRRLRLAILFAVALVAACDPGATATSAPIVDATAPAASSVATPAASQDTAPTPVLSVDPMTPGTSAAPPAGQTETDFGTIWDGVPSGFPRFTGARDADDAGPEPVSDIYAVAGGDPAIVAEWLQSAMEAATYSTEGLSGPFEDGGYELVSTGADGCRVRTTVTPRGDQVFVAVQYGAACPAA